LNAAPRSVTYEYTVVKGGIRHRHGLSVVSDGQMTYLHAVEKGEPKRFPLKRDPKLAKAVMDAYGEAGSGQRSQLACGAPRFGLLTAELGSGETRRHDLYDQRTAFKYSRLARLLERRLQPLAPEPPFSDCLALDVPPKPEILKDPGAYSRWYPTASMRSPAPYFAAYVEATTDEARVEALEKIVRIRGADPFFARYLVTTFPYSAASRDLLTHHSAMTVLSVTDGRQAGKLLKKLARGHNLEHKYYLTLLYLLRYEFPKAASACRTYFAGLGRHGEGEKEAAAILRAQEAMGQLNKGDSSWSRQIHAVGSLFEFWLTWAQRIEAPGQREFPLGKRFYERAFHYARMYAGDLKVGNIPSTPRGRAFLKIFLPTLAQTLWWTLPPFVQHDIVQTITALRAMPKVFGGVKAVEPLIPPLSKRIWELGRMRRFRAAQELMQKYESKGNPAAMKYAMGRALFEMERWEEALSYLKEAQDSGGRGVTRMTILASLHLGKVDFNEPPAELEESLGRVEWFVSMGLFEMGRQLAVSLRKAKLGDRGRLWLAKLQLALGQDGGVIQLKQLSAGKGDEAEKARFLLAELYLADGASFEKVYGILARSLYGLECARAFALLAAAARKNGAPNGQLFLARGAQAARENPAQWLGYLDALIRFGVYPAEAYLGSQEALAHFQRSSHLAWLRAALFLRSGQAELALNEIQRALHVQPNNEKYKKLKILILKHIKK